MLIQNHTSEANVLIVFE